MLSRRGASARPKGSRVLAAAKLLIACCVTFPLVLLLLSYLNYRVVSDETVINLVHKYSDLTGGEFSQTSVLVDGPSSGSKDDNSRKGTQVVQKVETTDPTKGSPPAYVISLVQCSNNPTGFLDAAAVFLESVRQNSATNPDSGARYGYAAYAIVHKQCEHHAALLERLGFKTLVKDTPFKREDIRGVELRNSIERALCCGSAEYIKLYAYTLTDHPVVLHFDIDCIVTQPLDELFDAMLYPNDHPRYKEAMKAIPLERKNDPIPERIDAFLSMDYSLNWPWHREAPVQGGWLVVRPSQKAFDDYIDIVLEGNYTGGFNNEAGWGHVGFGGWIGSAAIQGIVAYYYGHFHRGGSRQNYVELDVCRYNQIGADMIFRKSGDSQGHCKKFARNPGEEFDCTDCRNTDISLVKSIHYCACKKPWTCPVAREKQNERNRIDVLSGLVNLTTCNLLHKEWFKLRRLYEDRMVKETGDKRILETRRGTFQEDIFMNYCEDEGKYIPIVHPESVTKGI